MLNVKLLVFCKPPYLVGGFLHNNLTDFIILNHSSAFIAVRLLLHIVDKPRLNFHGLRLLLIVGYNCWYCFNAQLILQFYCPLPFSTILKMFTNQADVSTMP